MVDFPAPEDPTRATVWFFPSQFVQSWDPINDHPVCSSYDGTIAAGEF